jgi:hypothetical protein
MRRDIDFLHSKGAPLLAESHPNIRAEIFFSPIAFHSVLIANNQRISNQLKVFYVILKEIHAHVSASVCFSEHAPRALSQSGQMFWWGQMKTSGEGTMTPRPLYGMSFVVDCTCNSEA